jgi:short chain dehydrogenase
MGKKLEGKIAVITGATSGMALATAKLFVEEGAYVFITGRRQQQLDAAVQEIGENVTGVQGDAANLADLDRLYDKVKAKKGQIDILYASDVRLPVGRNFLQGRRFSSYHVTRLGSSRISICPPADMLTRTSFSPRTTRTKLGVPCGLQCLTTPRILTAWWVGSSEATEHRQQSART